MVYIKKIVQELETSQENESQAQKNTLFSICVRVRKKSLSKIKEN